jgi:hypothetical protein
VSGSCKVGTLVYTVMNLRVLAPQRYNKMPVISNSCMNPFNEEFRVLGVLCAYRFGLPVCSAVNEEMCLRKRDSAYVTTFR